MNVSACVHAQSCPSLFDSMDCSPPGSSIQEIFHVRILKWLFPSPGALPYPEIKPASLALSLALAGGFFTTELAGKPLINEQLGREK